jgi:hypothetical protein
MELSMIAEKDINRFWSKVDKRGPTDCWPWLGKPNIDGYGTITIAKETFGAHCIAYKITRGDIPKGICVCHTCDNRICCNPEHLFLGSRQDNMQDMMKKGRHLLSNRPSRKYSPDLIEAMKADRAAGISLGDLHHKYQVARGDVPLLLLL